MKKFGRFFSGIAAIMLGVGILMIVFGIKGAKTYWEKQDDNRNIESMSRTMSTAKKIKMDIPFGMVEIGVSDNGEIQFFGENIDKDSIIIKEDQGQIDISVKEQYEKIRLFNLDIPIFSGMDFGELNRRRKAPTYILLLPWNSTGELDVHVDCGELSIAGIGANSIKLEVGLGEIKVEEGYAENLELLCHAGAAYVNGDFLIVDAEVEIGDLDLTLFGQKEMYSGRLSGKIGDISYGVTDFYGNKRYYKHRGGFGFVRSEKFSGSGNGEVDLSCKIGSIGLWFLGDVDTVLYQDAVAIPESDVWEGCLDNWEMDNWDTWNSGVEITEDFGECYDLGFQNIDELEAELSELFDESNLEEEAKKATILNIVNVLELYDWKKEKAVCDIMDNQEMDDLVKGTAILEVLRELNRKEEKMKEAAQIMLDDIDSQDWKEENKDILDELYGLSDNSYWKELENTLENILENWDLNDAEKREEVKNILETFEVGSFGRI